MPDWEDINYLKDGNCRQKAAYCTLTRIGIMNILSDYNPMLVGTVPIHIDIASSDLDIICNSSNLDKFQLLVKKHFGNYTSFSDSLNDHMYVASFFTEDFEIEIFSQSRPTTSQNAYRHMVIEYRLLNIGGNRFREDIIGLKNGGYKTEPAFGKLLGLSDPFEELLQMENVSDENLTIILSEKGYLE